MVEVFIGVGSNMGDREDNIRLAVKSLSLHGKIKVMSSLYETEPEGYEKQPYFLNCVVSIDTDITAHVLLQNLKDIEKKAGRKSSFRNAPRTLDLDILFYGDSIVNTQDLVIPHPRLPERSFVLVPLVEIAPSFMHPVLHKTAQQMLSELTKDKKIARWGKLDAGLIRR